MPFAADAAGLGRLTVISGLGEPLNAEIELLSTSAEELASLTAAIAPEEAYAVQGIERTGLQGAIKIEVSKKPDGSPILKLSTNQAVSDPFLDMLIQVDWSTGRLLREYTVLLDPPGYAEHSGNSSSAMSPPVRDNMAEYESATPITKKSKSASVSKASGSKSANGKKSGKHAMPAEESPPPAEPAPGDSGSTESVNGEDHTTVRGDTLSAIAGQMKPEGVNLEQMLVGLYRANKNAFVGDNMNRLKVGQILHAPSPEELQAISRKEAAQQIHVQTADWNAYRNKLAGIVAESAPAGEGSNQSTGGKITSAAEDKSAPAAEGPHDVVKLSKNDTGTNNGKASDAKALKEKLNALDEEATAREKTIKEANERTAMLEKQVADMQKLLTVKNQAMADMQKSAAAPTPATKPEAPVPAKPVVEPPKPAQATKPAEPAKPVEVPKPAEAAKPVEAPKPAAPVVAEKPAATPAPPPAAQPNPEATPDAVKPAKKKKIIVHPPQPTPQPEPGLLDGLPLDPLVLGGIGGGVVLLIGGWLFMRNKRKRGLDSFEQGILTSGGLKANTVFGNTAGGTVDTGDTSFLTDFSQSSAGMIDTHDVDPIAEAEVYMAYGRDAQAEEILKDAIAKEPKRYELHLKLLEILAARKDSSGFETVAGELYSTLGSNDPTWAKVAEIGRKMEPDNPLYDTASASTAAATSHAPASTEQKLDADEFANAEVMTESSLDFSLDADSNEGSVATPVEAAQDSSLDFDLGMPAAPTESLAEAETLPDLGMPASISAPEPEADNSLDFPMEMPELAPAPTPPQQVAEEKTDNSLQFNVAEFGQTLPGLDMSGMGSVEDKAEKEAETPAIAEAFTEADISFDLPEIGTVEAAPAPAAELDMPDFDKTMIMKPEFNAGDIVFEAAPEPASAPLELPQMDVPPAMEPSLEVAEPADTNASTDLDFNFDLGAEAASETPIEAEMTKAAELDLSGISLDFDSSAEPAAEQIATSGGESPEVDTKLDLVTAYIDMGDSEGARELLDEVLKEGGSQQRERAQKLLDSLA
jgi:pilus assembly protein FimV